MKLNEMYTNSELSCEEELLYHYIDDTMLEFEFEPMIASPSFLMSLTPPSGDITLFEQYRDYAENNSIEYIKDIVSNFDGSHIIVINGKILIDGYHHAIAAILSNKSLQYIDLETFQYDSSLKM